MSFLGNGTIEFHEFLNIMARKMNEDHNEDDMYEAFKFFDKDNNGFITPTELKSVMFNIVGQNLSDGEVKDMIREVDTDSDGKVNYNGMYVHVIVLHWERYLRDETRNVFVILNIH